MRRALAFAIDWIVIAGWGGCLFAAVWLLRDGQAPPTMGPWLGQAVGFAAMTLPVVITFAALESSHFQASLGKRVIGLRVTDHLGRRPTFRRALTRNAIKFLPWECGHMVPHHAIAAADGAPPTWLYLPMAASMIASVWWLAVLFRTGHSPYDRWSGTRVEECVSQA